MPLLLMPGRAAAAAEVCGNPWGTALPAGSPGSETLKPEHVRLCLPAGFTAEARENSVVFRDLTDAKGARGRIGLAVSADRSYKHSDSREDYEKLKVKLCQLSNATAGTLCSVTQMQGKFFVVLKGLQAGVFSEVFFHIGDGYLLALTADAPDSDAYAVLQAVVQGAIVP